MAWAIRKEAAYKKDETDEPKETGEPKEITYEKLFGYICIHWLYTPLINMRYLA